MICYVIMENDSPIFVHFSKTEANRLKREYQKATDKKHNVTSAWARKVKIRVEEVKGADVYVDPAPAQVNPLKDITGVIEDES